MTQAKHSPTLSFPTVACLVPTLSSLFVQGGIESRLVRCEDIMLWDDGNQKKTVQNESVKSVKYYVGYEPFLTGKHEAFYNSVL